MSTKAQTIDAEVYLDFHTRRNEQRYRRKKGNRDAFWKARAKRARLKKGSDL